MGKRVIWNEAYKRKCFDVWYLNGRPNLAARIKEIIPEEDGRKPSSSQINQWLNSGAWDMLADELDAQADEKANLALVDMKVAMLRRHQEQAAKIQIKALDYLMAEGFDTSASAVQALFRGAEEERKTAGFSDLLEKLESMNNNQVRDQIIAMVQRAADNNQIVAGNDDEDVINAEDDTVSDIEE